MLNNTKLFAALADELHEKFASWHGFDVNTAYTPEEMVVTYRNFEGYEGGNRTVVITALDEVVDLTMLYGDTMTYHLVLDTANKVGYIDVKNSFVCDADAGVIGTLQDHFGISWRDIANRYETLCQQLDRAIEAAKRPTLEEWLKAKLEEIAEEGPVDWDEEEDDED